MKCEGSGGEEGSAREGQTTRSGDGHVVRKETAVFAPRQAPYPPRPAPGFAAGPSSAGSDGAAGFTGIAGGTQ